MTDTLALIWNFYELDWLVPAYALIFVPILLAFLVWYYYQSGGGRRVLKLEALKTLFAFGENGGYHRCHHLSLTDGSGAKVGIDCVLFSPYGIFVIDSGIEGGFIVGGEQDDQWKRMGGKSEKSKTRVFQNPLRQNRKKAEVLRSITGLSGHCFHPLVVCADDAVFQSPMPYNMIPLRKLEGFVAARKAVVLSDNEIQNAIAVAGCEPSALTNAVEKFRNFMREIRP